MSLALLRIVLCLCLLLDGMAPAFAAIRIHVQDAMDAPAAAPHAQASDCHGAETAASAPSAPAPDDCLQRCLDLCLQQGHALGRQALAMTPPGPDAAPLAHASARPPASRPFPPLRPPIV